MKLKMLDLFSGIGGFSLAAHWTGQIETVAFCEIEPYCQKLLQKHWPDVPIFEDVRTLKGEDVGPVDIICGGYPCQPFSLAGKRAGADDDRHLWPEVHRLLQELRPRRFLGENVVGHVTMGLDQVLSDLESIGYSCQTLVVPACAKDAPHRRDRTWIVADSGGEGLEGGQQCSAPQERKRAPRPVSKSGCDGGVGNVGNSERSGCSRDARWGAGPQLEDRRWWPTEPPVGRVANGVPRRVDRIKALGNSIVPQVAYEIFTAMLAAN